MNSQTISLSTGLYRKNSRTLSEKITAEKLYSIADYTPRPIKEIVVSFWRVWTAKVD